MLARSAWIPDELLGAAIMVPSQWPGPRRERPDGARALLLRLLADALHCADLGPRIRRRQGPAPRTGPDRGGTHARATRIALARRWLLGDLDAEVALPVSLVCDALGIDAGVLSAAVTARATPREPAGVAPPRGTRTPPRETLGTCPAAPWSSRSGVLACAAARGSRDLVPPSTATP